MGIIKSISNMIFPQEHICLFCKENMTNSKKYICLNCMEMIEILNREVDTGSPYIEKVYYSVFYNRYVRSKLHAFKFQGKNYLYKPFGEILIDTIKENNLQDKVVAIAFVPIHRRKEALRGYNQSELLGKYVADKLSIPLLKKNLLKIRWTLDQNKLGKIERQDNLKGSFKAKNKEDFRNKEILLIDDIITTGTTMEECAKVLITNGARKVYGLALTSSMKV